jgi:hypothetical protein
MIIAARIGFFLLLTASSYAQQWIGVQAGMVNYAQGDFYIGEEKLQFPEARSREIPKGTSLRTGDGWVEIQLGPYAFLWMGEEGTLQMVDPSLTDTQLLLERGSIVIEIYEQTEQTDKNTIRICSGGAVVELKKIGLYRVDSERPQLRVYEGKAQIQVGRTKTTVREGRAAVLDGKLKLSRFDMKKTEPLLEHATGRSAVLTGPIKEARRSKIDMQNQAEQARQQHQAAAAQTQGAYSVPQPEPGTVWDSRSQQDGHPQPWQVIDP